MTYTSPLPAVHGVAQVRPVADFRPGAGEVDPRAGGRSPCIVWGYDPGAQGALAVLEVASPRPRLLWSCALTATRGPERVALHRAALVGLCDAALAIAGVPHLLALEVPAEGGKSRGGVKALALAQVFRDAGWMVGYVQRGWGVEVLELESGAWAKALGLPTGKQPAAYGMPEGAHRVPEAGLHVDCSRAGLVAKLDATTAERVRLVARAEAALIGAAAIRRKGWR